MNRRLSIALAAILLLLASTIPANAGARWAQTGTPRENVGGPCTGSAANYHVFVRRLINLEPYSYNWYDIAEGTATVVNMPICTGIPGVSDGFSAVLPVNIEHAGGGSAKILQLGYRKTVGDLAPHFVYTLGSAVGIKITSVAPWVGYTYRFVIYRRSSGYASYEIWRGTELIWSLHSGTSWGTPNVSWYGYETETPQDAHDNNTTNPRARLTQMKYSTKLSTSLWTVSDLVCSGGATFDTEPHKNFTWDGSTPLPGIPSWGKPCEGTRDAYISDTVYNNDTLDVLTTD